MLIVLPPSRGQTPGPAGADPLVLDRLSLPDLTDQRVALLAALAGTEDDPASHPTAPAAEVFTGVLYSAAGLPALLRRTVAPRVRESVLIASPLLGMVGPADPVPASRLAMGRVPVVGSLAAHWRPDLQAALDDRVNGDLVLDARSGEFAPLWRPPATADWVTTSVVQQVGDSRRIVSHSAKHWRGLLAHHLLGRRAAPPQDARGLLRAVRGLIRSGDLLDVTLTPAPSPGRPSVLTLIVR